MMPTASEPRPDTRYAGTADERADILRMKDAEIRRLDAELAAARDENVRLRRQAGRTIEIGPATLVELVGTVGADAEYRGVVDDGRAAIAEHVRERWPELVFAAFCALSFGFDLLIVELGYESISARFWDQTAAHPTLIAAGMLAAVGVGYVLRRSWPAVLLWGLLMGHLFIHQ